MPLTIYDGALNTPVQVEARAQMNGSAARSQRSKQGEALHLLRDKLFAWYCRKDREAPDRPACQQFLRLADLYSLQPSVEKRKKIQVMKELAGNRTQEQRSREHHDNKVMLHDAFRAFCASREHGDSDVCRSFLYRSLLGIQILEPPDDGGRSYPLLADSDMIVPSHIEGYRPPQASQPAASGAVLVNSAPTILTGCSSSQWHALSTVLRSIIGTTPHAHVVVFSHTDEPPPPVHACVSSRQRNLTRQYECTTSAGERVHGSAACFPARNDPNASLRCNPSQLHPNVRTQGSRTPRVE